MCQQYVNKGTNFCETNNTFLFFIAYVKIKKPLKMLVFK
jgi:hypothetical protein